MKRPDPTNVGKVRIRVHSGPRKDGKWRWRADRASGLKDGKEVRTPIWSGWALDGEEACRLVMDVLTDRGEAWHSTDDVRTVGDLLSVWVADVGPHDRSPYTTRARKGSADRLSEAPIARVRLDRLDTRALDAFVRGYVGAASTCRADLISLRAAWAWGRERDLVPDRPLVRVKNRKGPAVYDRYTPTAEEVAKVIARLKLRRTRPPGWSWRAVYLLWATGCRPGEIATLPWECVELDRCRMVVVGKTGSREIRIHPTVAAEMKTWEHHGKTVVGCQPASVLGHLHNSLTKACADVGCPRWSLYGLRRAAVATLYRAGEDPTVAAEMLGHSVATAWKHYRQVAESDMAAAVLRTGMGLLPEIDRDNVVDFNKARKGEEG